MMKQKMIFACLSLFGAMALMAEDAYVETDYTQGQGINTGYCMTPNTRWEVDFQLTETTNKQARIVGGDHEHSDPKFFVSCYINGGGHFSFGAGNTFKAFSTGIPVDTARHTAILDCFTKKMYYVDAAGVTKTTAWVPPRSPTAATLNRMRMVMLNPQAINM